MDLYKKIKFPIMGDSRGSLIAIENNQEIPFEIKRIYYIYDTATDVTRGCHAHKKLQQVAICLHGSCTFVLDDGSKREEVLLSSREEGLLLKGVIWREMKDFSRDAVLLVLADSAYDESDYIRNYNDFIKYIKN